MLRLPSFRLEQPDTLPQALALLDQAGPEAAVLAGGTDLLPNMKHELRRPSVVIALSRVPGLTGIAEAADGAIEIGAMTPLAEVAQSALVARALPALAQAAALVAGPQLRQRGTLGGNVLLDTRCQYVNQSHFWRSALGFCLKKDGTVCHVVAGGSRCVAAASADTVPALMTLGAVLEIARHDRTRQLPIDAFFVADGIVNRRLEPTELLTRVRVPRPAAGHRGAYGKLRERGSIDFPLLGVAARLDLSEAGVVEHADLVLTSLAAAPRRVAGAADALRGSAPGHAPAEFETAVRRVAELARRQCRPLPNLPGDHEWRGEMVPVYARRTLLAAAAGQGPVHHV